MRPWGKCSALAGEDCALRGSLINDHSSTDLPWHIPSIIERHSVPTTAPVIHNYTSAVVRIPSWC